MKCLGYEALTVLGIWVHGFRALGPAFGAGFKGLGLKVCCFSDFSAAGCRIVGARVEGLG